MSDTRILNYVDARTGKDCQINVPKDAAWLMVQTLHIAGINVPKDAAWLMVQTLHIAGVEAYIEFTEDDLVTVK